MQGWSTTLPTNSLFIVYDFYYGGIQRLDLSSGETLWTNANSADFSFTSDGFQYLLTDTTLYFSLGPEIRATDRSTGEMMQIAPNADYDIYPLALAGDTLLVRARRTRGTEKFELWGIKAATGEPAWKLDLLGAEPIDPPDEMAGLIDNEDAGWTWKLLPAGLVVITFQGEPNQLVVETFDPATGCRASAARLCP